LDGFPEDVLKAVAEEREVRLTTTGRKSGKASTVTIWIVTDGDRVFIRSGQGMRRHWPQNLMKHPIGTVQLGKKKVRFQGRLVTDPTTARHSSFLYGPKYGASVKPSKEAEPLTLGEQATFQLFPAGE
jgi:deazaflavin-dependent oxidoreductase (nitroreductase family)